MKDDWYQNNVSKSNLRGGGTNFKTRKFVKKKTTKVIFQRTFPTILMPLIFMSSFFLWAFTIGREPYLFTRIISLFPVIGLTSFGVFLYIKTNKLIVFDKKIGYYYKSIKKPNFRKKQKKNCTKLSNISGIQVLREYVVRQKSTNYSSFEINLVLKDGNRLNVIDHGDEYNVIQDAKKLANFLNLPIWIHTS
tara:strand:- start:274 stop:849 length:576 start_codon:yes stop_codon:yes gene_type:complete